MTPFPRRSFLSRLAALAGAAPFAAAASAAPAAVAPAAPAISPENARYMATLGMKPGEVRVEWCLIEDAPGKFSLRLLVDLNGDTWGQKITWEGEPDRTVSLVCGPDGPDRLTVIPFRDHA